MRIQFNDSHLEVREDSSLIELLEESGIKLSGIAVAVNQEVVPRQHWPVFRLSENDSVLVIRAAQGG